MAKKSITGSAFSEAQANLDSLKAEWQVNNEKINAYVPETGDQETYDQLVTAVREATAKNESIAAFENRIKQLGSTAVSLAKTIGVLA